MTRPDEDELDRLYRGATALVLRPQYECFCFPPLEAMGHNCPVLASGIPAVRKISGCGALLLPVVEGAWVEAIRRVVDDGHFREERRERWRRTASKYSRGKQARGLCEGSFAAGGQKAP